MRPPETKITNLVQLLKSLPNGGLFAFRQLVEALWKQRNRIFDRASCVTPGVIFNGGEEAGRTYLRFASLRFAQHVSRAGCQPAFGRS
jgi:hypothetical protein